MSDALSYRDVPPPLSGEDYDGNITLIPITPAQPQQCLINSNGSVTAAVQVLGESDRKDDEGTSKDCQRLAVVAGDS